MAKDKLPDSLPDSLPGLTLDAVVYTVDSSFVYTVDSSFWRQSIRGSLLESLRTSLGTNSLRPASLDRGNGMTRSVADKIRPRSQIFKVLNQQISGTVQTQARRSIHIPIAHVVY